MKVTTHLEHGPVLCLPPPLLIMVHQQLHPLPGLLVMVPEPEQPQYNLSSSASKRSIRRFVITEKAPTSTRAFSWLKAPTSAFTFKTLLRHCAKQALTPRSLNVKLGP